MQQEHIIFRLFRNRYTGLMMLGLIVLKVINMREHKQIVPSVIKYPSRRINCNIFLNNSLNCPELSSCEENQSIQHNKGNILK